MEKLIPRRQCSLAPTLPGNFPNVFQVHWNHFTPVCTLVAFSPQGPWTLCDSQRGFSCIHPNLRSALPGAPILQADFTRTWISSPRPWGTGGGGALDFSPCTGDIGRLQPQSVQLRKHSSINSLITSPRIEALPWCSLCPGPGACWWEADLGHWVPSGSYFPSGTFAPINWDSEQRLKHLSNVYFAPPISC
jgi:hypothetical protein